MSDDIKSITPGEMAQLCSSGKAVDLIDVRFPAEYRTLHAPGARNIPFDQLDPHQVMRSRVAAKTDPVYIICQKGVRSMHACRKFVAAGHPNVVNVEGGTSAWHQEGLDVVRGRSGVMSVERQVRIVSGLIGLGGAVLGFFFSPYWLILPAFVGAGMLYSGLTDTCAMGSLLGKLPWNRR